MYLLLDTQKNVVVSDRLTEAQTTSEWKPKLEADKSYQKQEVRSNRSEMKKRRLLGTKCGGRKKSKAPSFSLTGGIALAAVLCVTRALIPPPVQGGEGKPAISADRFNYLSCRP